MRTQDSFYTCARAAAELAWAAEAWAAEVAWDAAAADVGRWEFANADRIMVGGVLVGSGTY